MQEFPFATHLTCAIHLRRNVKQQLSERKCPDEHRCQTLDEIFGAKRGTLHFEGLINCKTGKEFDDKLAALKPLWDEREASSAGCSCGFYDWFVANKADILKNSAIAPI